MDISTDSATGSRLPQWHSWSGLPRPWVRIPAPVCRQALDDPLLRGLFPTHAGYFPEARAHRVERERGLRSTIFNYCVAGRGGCSVGGLGFEVGPGDLMVVPAGRPHTYAANPDDPWTLHWCHAMGEHLPRLLELLGVTVTRPVVHLGHSPALESLFEEMRRAIEEDCSPPQLLYAAQVLGHLLGAMLRLRRTASSAVPSAARRVRRTIEHMQRHLATRFSLSDLAALAELSPSHFSQLVRNATGHSPKDYLTHLRVHRAAQLLDTTDLTVRQIAEAVGFADALHFSRVFRRIHQQSPTQYRADRDAIRPRPL